MSRFFDDVQPALMQAREERIRAETEKVERVLRTFFPIKFGSHRQLYTNENQDKHGTSSSSRQIQWSPSASPKVTLDSPGITEVDRRQDILARPVGHSPSSDKIPLPTASEARGLLKPTTGDPIKQLDVFGVIKRANQHNGIDIAQSKEEAAE